jgi:excinuclease UvrABC nuclease subunit
VVAPDQMELIQRGAGVPMQCGVYVLWKESQLLYVGSSLNVQNRIAQHVWAGKIPFTGYSVVEVNDERILLMLEAIENAYIEALEPPFNLRKKGIRIRDEAKMARAIKAAWDACLV